MANVKSSYASSAALTVTLASLATSATLVAGRESTLVDNTSNLYLDYLLSGKITTGTTPTDVREIRVYVAGIYDDTTWPDVLDGTDSDETITSVGIRDAALKLAAVIPTNNTSDRTYWFGPISVASLFGGTLPKKWVVWITHNTAVNLNATGGNHVIWQTGVFETVA
jgi:hypothetical protein